LKLQAIKEQPSYRIQPLQRMDKPNNREERRGQQPSFAAVYKAQTSKRERRVHILALLLFMAVVCAQIGIAAGEITGPVYLANFIK